ncbi:MAG: hypothetical protein CMH54_15030 [Myxococcales bacterium]|nr:hypothetical protein [Myxococcales bacterium]
MQISGSVQPTVEFSGQISLVTALPGQVQPFLENYEASKGMLAQMVQSLLQQGGGQRGMPAALSEGYGAIIVDAITNTSLKYDAGTKTITFNTKPQTSLDQLIKVMSLGRTFQQAF